MNSFRRCMHFYYIAIILCRRIDAVKYSNVFFIFSRAKIDLLLSAQPWRGCRNTNGQQIFQSFVNFSISSARLFQVAWLYPLLELRINIGPRRGEGESLAAKTCGDLVLVFPADRGSLDPEKSNSYHPLPPPPFPPLPLRSSLLLKSNQTDHRAGGTFVLSAKLSP